MNLRTSFRPGPLGVFALACIVPLAFALYRQHAWEDYFITFRASRNLATENGLVFNVGDKVYQLDVHGRDYLEFDSEITIYCKRP